MTQNPTPARHDNMFAFMHSFRYRPASLDVGLPGIGPNPWEAAMPDHGSSVGISFPAS